MKTIRVLAMAACGLLMALPMMAASAKAPASSAWPAETLSGKIISVDPNRNIMVVKTPGGVPFDFDISRHTQIQSGGQALTIKDLTNDVNKDVSVKFVPERRGDVAKTIQLNG